MIIDIIVLIILFISAGIAFLRGVIRETLTIAGVIGGMAAAYFFGDNVSPIFAGWLGIEAGEEAGRLFDIVPYTMVADGLAYGAVFIGVVIILSIVSHILAESVKTLGLGAIDRSLGVVFGLARGLLLLGLLYLPVYMMVAQETKDKWFAGSRTHFYIEKTAGFIHAFLPEGTLKQVEEKTEEAKDINSTREKLQQIDLLGGEKKDAESTGTGEGYQEEFRDKMNELFQEKDVDVLRQKLENELKNNQSNEQYNE